MLRRLLYLILTAAASWLLLSCQAQAGSGISSAVPVLSIATSTRAAALKASPVSGSAITSTPDAVRTPTYTPAAPIEPACFETYFFPIAFMPDSQRILVRGETGVQIFDLEKLVQEQFIPAPTTLSQPAVALSPDGQELAWALEDHSIQWLRISDQQLLHTLTGHTGPITKLRFSPAGDRLISASHDGWVRAWDRDGVQVGEFQPGGGEVLGLGISPDGKLLATVPFDGPMRLWTLPDFEPAAELVARQGGNGGFDTSDAVFSPDGQYLAADLATGLFLWRVPDRKELLGGNPGINSMAMAFSPDGRYLAYVDIDQGNRIILVSPDGSQSIKTLEGNQAPVWELFFSPDSSLLVSTDGNEIRIWQVETGELRYIGKASCRGAG